MLSRSLCLVLVLACAVQTPSPAWAAPAGDVDARAGTLFEAGRYLEAAQLFVDALNGLSEGAEGATRNVWTSGAVTAYKYAFAADPAQCGTATAGIALADRYLADLIVASGPEARNGDAYIGMQGLRTALDEARAQQGCVVSQLVPEAPVTAPETVEPQTMPSPLPSATPAPVEPPRRQSDGRGWITGLGVSAGMTVGMTVASAVTFTQLRKPNGRYYIDIVTAASASGVGTDRDTDMCESTAGRAALDTACSRWHARERLFIATTTLAGVFAVGTAVFTGLLIRHRHHPGPRSAALRRHQAHFALTPQRSGGSLIAGFRF